MARSPRVQLVVDGRDNTKKTFGAVSKSLDALEKKTTSIGRAMAASLTGIISITALKRIADVNTEMSKLDRVLRENTESQKAFNYAQQDTARIADELGVSIGKVVNDFGGLNGSMAALGYSSKEAIRVTETLSKLMSLEGADPGPTIKRFTRALSKGELHQARFNLMLQDQPALLDLVSAATGRTIEELRELSKTGELTALMLTDSVLEMGDAIDDRFSEVPQTIEQAMNRINNNIAGAFRDDELMAPLTESLIELSEVLKDPAVREGLAILATGLSSAGTKAVTATSELGLAASGAKYLSKNLLGLNSELEKVENRLKTLERIERNQGLAGFWGNLLAKPLGGEKYLQQQRFQLEMQRESIISEMTGTTVQMRTQESLRQEMLKEEKEKEAAIQRKYVNDLKEYNKQAVKAVTDRGKELAKAEKEAAKKVVDARKEIADIEKQFDDIRKEMTAGGDKEPSFAEYQSLATSARKAMAAGDTAKAKEDALAAANVLKELAAAGENTYGFGGMVNSMEGIAKSAAELDQANAQEKLEEIQLEMAALAEQAEELENMPVSVELDDESLEHVKTQISNLLEQLKVEAVIPVRAVTGDIPEPASLPGYASGGRVRGPGTGTSDSILARLSNGEYVMRAAAVEKYGANLLDNMNGLRIPRFADGGLVAQAASMEQQQKNIGTLNFNLGGSDAFSVDVAGTSNMDALHRAALKFGRTRK